MKNFPFKTGDIVELRPTKGASQRTKNRIRENGPRFNVRQSPRSVLDLGESVFLDSDKTGWFGWLPLSEVEVAQQVDSIRV